MQCKWSKGKGTCLDCKGCRFESCPVLILSLLKFTLREIYLFHNDSIVLFCCGLNLLHNTLKWSVFFQHCSCFLAFRVCTNLSHSNVAILVLVGPHHLLVYIVIGHKMSCTSISKLHNSWYFPMVFQSNIGCLTAELLDLGIVCIGLALLTGLYASLTAITTTLSASISACGITRVMLCSIAIYTFFH